MFAATYTGGAAQVSLGQVGELFYRWTIPTQVAAYDTVPLPNGSLAQANNAVSMVYDSVNDRIYVLLGAPIDNGTSNLLYVASVNPHTLATTMLVDGIAVSLNSQAEGPNPAICTDGTYIYLLSCASTQSSSVFKIRCSDGGLDSSVQLPLPAGGNFTVAGDVIAVESGFLYVAGSLGKSGATPQGWAGRLPTDLSTQTLILVAADPVNDDFALTPDGFFWLGSENPSHPGQLSRVAKDMSGVTTIVTGVPGWIDAILYDGTNLWLSQVVDPLAANIVVYDPVGLAVVRWFSLRPGEIHMNELALTQNNTALWSASYNATSTVPSQVVLTPLLPDPTVTPRPVYGHGGM